MSDAIHEAPKRLRFIKSLGSVRWGCDMAIVYPGCSHEQCLDRIAEDERLVVDAFLAKYPDDDDEPITEKWLLEEGWTRCRDLEAYAVTLSNGAGLYYRIADGAVFIGDPFFELFTRKPETRGGLRRLCELLGVEEIK